METVRGQYNKLRNIGEKQQDGTARQESFNQGRRSFLGKFVALVGTAFGLAVLYPIAKYVYPPKRQQKQEDSSPVAKLAEIPDNTGKIVKFNGKAVMVINKGNGNLSAMSAVCTHAGCNVAYKGNDKVIYCACHGGTYDPTTGAVLGGPPPAPLALYPVKVVGNDIVLSKA
jgi:cytochrome b6-f complex iron-sulfur subunit